MVGIMLAVAFFFMFASAAAVKQDQAQLRDGCEANDPVVATLPAGSAVEIRFAMSGASETCYKVRVTSGTQVVDGYLPASALDGLDTFRKSVESAPSLSASPAAPARSLPKLTPGANELRDSPLARSYSLLEQNQPRAALDVLERGMKVTGRNYQMLLAAGIAAYRSDESRLALEYLKEAEQLHSD